MNIIEAGLRAVEPAQAMRERVSVTPDGVLFDGYILPFGEAGTVHVVALGKCAANAAVALEKILGDRLAGGVVLDIADPPRLRRLTYFQGDHPLPSARNEVAAEAVVTLLQGLDEENRVLFVVSGGASTLLYDSDELTPEEEARMIRHLSEKGATIEELNTMRKHLSKCRGGNLAKYAYPARSAALIISDVPSNDIEFVASGPTVKDTTTIDDAAAILAKYRVIETCDVAHCRLLETPKEDKYFLRMQNVLFLSHADGLRAMKEEAERLGFTPDVCAVCVTGNARVMGARMVEDLHAVVPRTALLYGGETTVVVRHDGKGGRNQELMLAALPHVAKGELIAAIASDGWDNTPHAGALADTLTWKRARELGLSAEDALARNDSYHFFEAVDDALVTGRLGSNVADLFVALKE